MQGEGVGAILPNYAHPRASSSYHTNDEEENYPIFDQSITKNDGDQKEISRTPRKKLDRTPAKDKDDLLCAGWVAQESPFLKRRKRAGSLDTESLSEDHSVSTQENSESHNEFSTDLNGSWIASVPPEEDNLMKSEDEVVKAPDEPHLPSVVESSLFAGQSTPNNIEESMVTEDLSPLVSKIKGKVETQSEFDRLYHSSNTNEFFPKEHDEIEKPFICPVHGACPADSYPSLSDPSLFEDISSPQKVICEHPNCHLSKASSIVNMEKMGRNSPSDFLKRKSKLTTKRKMDRNAQLHSPDLKMRHREYCRSQLKPPYKSLISSKKPSSRKLIGCDNNNYIRHSDDDAIFPDQPASALVECHMLDDDHAFHFQVPPHEIGFCNLGNTCFVNSTLQVLLALPGFVKSLHENCEGRMDLPTAIMQLDEIAESRKLGDGVLVQKNLRNFISDLWQLNEVYSNGDQHDANEFLLRLMAIIKTSLPNGPIEKFFEFDMVEIHECLKCGEITRRVRHESNLCLPIGLDSHYIEQCLESYLEEEERSITCDRCQGRATKVSNKFRNFPRNLVLTLNRYSKEEKIMQFISPPDKIDLRKFLEEPEKYEAETEFTLVGKITHLGHSKFSGHYICDVLCEDGSWRSYNDEHVSSIPLKCEAESLDDPAYIFFFTRQESSVPFPEIEQ